MNNENKKSITIGEYIAKLHPSTLVGDQLSGFKGMGKSFVEDLRKAKTVALPIIEEMNQIHTENDAVEPTDDGVFINHHSVKHDILEELREMNKNHRRLLTSQEDSNVIIYDTKNGSLNRHLGGKCFSYDLTENGKRKKLLEVLLNRESYVQTKELSLLVPSSAVAKMVQTFNDYAISALRLDKKTKLIQGKKGSGYRINPKIHIEKE